MSGKLRGTNMDRMPGWAFRIMAFMFDVTDLFRSPDRKLDPFDIRNGATVADWGCGTGRFLKSASERVGPTGTVYAVDIHELAIGAARRVMDKYRLGNVKPVQTDGKSVEIPSRSVDVIYALDMFHMVSDPDTFLKELNRIIKPAGILYLEDGHQPRELSKQKIERSGCWKILEESKEHLKCIPLNV